MSQDKKGSHQKYEIDGNFFIERRTILQDYFPAPPESIRQFEQSFFSISSFLPPFLLPSSFWIALTVLSNLGNRNTPSTVPSPWNQLHSRWNSKAIGISLGLKMYHWYLTYFQENINVSSEKVKGSEVHFWVVTTKSDRSKDRSKKFVDFLGGFGRHLHHPGSHCIWPPANLWIF